MGLGRRKVLTRPGFQETGVSASQAGMGWAVDTPRLGPCLQWAFPPSLQRSPHRPIIPQQWETLPGRNGLKHIYKYRKSLKTAPSLQVRDE